MAEAFNLPVVSHGVPEIHVHLVGAAPNGLTVEYMPRLFHLWEEVPVPRDGLLAMPAAPGSASNSALTRSSGSAPGDEQATRQTAGRLGSAAQPPASGS